MEGASTPRIMRPTQHRERLMESQHRTQHRERHGRTTIFHAVIGAFITDSAG